jgi:CRP-like cAMP-binding protein
MELPPIFHYVHEDDIEATLEWFHEVEADMGTLLMEEGDADPSMIVVLSGDVEISHHGLKLTTAGPGDLIGEMSLFGSGVRTAQVRSISPVSFLVLERQAYEALRDHQHPVAHAIEQQAMATLGSRLRDTAARFARDVKGSPINDLLGPPESLSDRVKRFLAGFTSKESAAIGSPVDVLARSPLFSGAPVPVLEVIASAMRELSCNKGEQLCAQGELGSEMFVLASGAVEVVVTAQGVGAEGENVEHLASLQPGDAFGMVSLHLDLPRMATCVCSRPSRVLALDRPNWLQLTGRGDVVGSWLRTAMIRALADAVATTSARLAALDVHRRQSW